MAHEVTGDVPGRRLVRYSKMTFATAPTSPTTEIGSPAPDGEAIQPGWHGGPDLRKTARVRAFIDVIAAAILDHRALLEGRG